MRRSKGSGHASQSPLTTALSSGRWWRSQPWCLRISEGWCHSFWLYVADIWAFPGVERGSVWPSVCLCVSAGSTLQTGTIITCVSVCVFMSLLGHNTANVIKQVLYCSRFLISKAFAAAMCVMNPFLFSWTFWYVFVWDVQTCRTNIGSEMHFFITLVKGRCHILNHMRML